MEENPIEQIMKSAMTNIKQMVDVDTVIGEAIITKDNTSIIPVSKVSFGFAAGGSEFKTEAVEKYSKVEKQEEVRYRLPFGGGAGSGINIEPIAFLVIQEGTVKLIEPDHESVVDKLAEYVPDVIDKLSKLIDKKLECKENTDFDKTDK